MALKQFLDALTRFRRNMRPGKIIIAMTGDEIQMSSNLSLIPAPRIIRKDTRLLAGY